MRRYPVGCTPRGFKSSVLLQSAPNAVERNAQNVKYLSSGAYGSFHHREVDAAVPVGHSQTICPTQALSQRSQPQTSARASGREELIRGSRDSQQQAVHNRNASLEAPYSMMTQRTKMKSMLADLDSSFSRRNKYDLSTAIAGPPTDVAHLKLYGVMNHKNYEEGGRWTNSLRRSGKQIAPK